MSDAVHDKKVAELAKKYKDQGYIVWADVDGYSDPWNINGHLPDLIVMKNSEVKIIEVETIASYSSEHAQSQAEAFRRRADNEPGTTFEIVLA